MRLVQKLLEVGQARVRATEDRDLLERRAELADCRDDFAALRLRRGEGAYDGLGTVVKRRAQHLLRAAELRHEPVRKLEHLRRRAVVLLEPHDERIRIAARHVEQMLRPGAGERVDRLVVVADHAEVVAAAEPMLEQLLLEQVDVLVLVDRERAVLRAERLAGPLVALEELHRELEQILEVERSLRLLAPLVVAVDPVHEVGRDRRLAPLRLGAVTRDGDAAVLRPLDLGRKVTRRPKLERRRQPVRDLPEDERLRGQDLADRLRCEMAQLPQRRGVEGSGAHATDPERLEARAQLARSLVGERHRHDLRRLEGAGRDLLRDPPRDRRRLAGTGAGEDANGAAHRLGGAPLLGIQAVERTH